MSELRLFAQNTDHVPSYDSESMCTFCGYADYEHAHEMAQIREKLKEPHNPCTHDCGGYPAHGKLWCHNCGASYPCTHECGGNQAMGYSICHDCGEEY